VLLGFIAKKSLKNGIDEKSIVALNIYFLLPMLAFWGLLSKEIKIKTLSIPLLYALIFLLALIISRIVAKALFSDPKDISIVTISSVTGVTGSIGIPLGISLLTNDSVIYTSLINTISMFLVYTIGVYIYSRGSFGISKSLINVFKMPIIWASLIAIVLNIYGIKLESSLFRSLKMGAYSAIVMQLVIFGIFLAETRLKSINLKLLGSVVTLNFILIPLISVLILSILNLSKIELGSILLEIIVPLAITNVSLASIFDCKPKEVTSLVFITSLIFIPFVVVLKFYLDSL
jgi:predicted permease